MPAYGSPVARSAHYDRLSEDIFNDTLGGAGSIFTKNVRNLSEPLLIPVPNSVRICCHHIGTTIEQIEADHSGNFLCVV